MLFFYDSSRRSAAIGALAPSQLTTTTTYKAGELGKWTHIVARNNLLLFYRRDTGAAAIAKLTPTGIKTTSVFDPTSFSRWTHIVNTGVGCFFYNRLTGAAAIGNFDAKTFRTTAELAVGSLADWTHVIAHNRTLLFYNRLSGGAAIAAVTPSGITTTTSFQPGSFGRWTHAVNHGSTVLFYSRDTGGGAIGTLSAKGFETHVVYNPGSFGAWTHVVAEGSTVLFYNQDTGGAAIGLLTKTDFASIGYYQPGELGRWTHITGHSSSGPEELEHSIAVLLCHWERPLASATVSSPDFYRRYFFDLSAEHGIGRYWFEQSGGTLRLTGHVSDWISLSKAPSASGVNKDRRAQAKLAVADATAAGWRPGRAQSVIVVIAADGAKGVDAGESASLKINGRNRSVLILHGDSQNYIQSNIGDVLDSNYRFDFNAHEVGHLLGGAYSFNHAFGPRGPYDNPYCIMSAKWYGERGDVIYDEWTAGSNRLSEEHTKGPGLSGATRAACGWARMRRLAPAQLQQGVELHLAHLGDVTSGLPQVIEWRTKGANGRWQSYTVEFRSPLAESDQVLRPTVVLCQRDGSQWSTNGTWGPRSSTYLSHTTVPRFGPVPVLSEPGIARVDVLEVAPAVSMGALSGPPWVRLRLSR
jgi:M6 family metalloprotease-like protein